MTEVAQFLALAFLAAMLLTGIHTYFGIHVLARNIIFVDLALAQISALGATVAFMLGYLPQSLPAYAYALAFTLAGAVVLTLSRTWSGKLSQEAFIGVIYVVSAAAAFLLVDKAPQGAEHIKQLLVGSILTVTGDDLLKLAGLYGLIGVFHWLFRKRFLQLARQSGDATGDGVRVWLWDFLFYASFGIVVTSSVAIAGVLLVFSFLIIPAAIGTIYSATIAGRLLIGWVAGTLASAAGLAASYWWDLPTGATMVCAFGATLIAAAAVKPLVLRQPHAYAKTWSGLTTGLVTVGLLSGAWLTLNHRADQPLLDAVETVVPAFRDQFLSADEREIYRQAAESAAKLQSEAERINTTERNSRWQGRELSDQELRKFASYVQSFQEMRKGEQFVLRDMRNKARERQRWVIGIPLLLICAGLILVLKYHRQSSG
jgi:zinc/manganese transport system permease protein